MPIGVWCPRCGEEYYTIPRYAEYRAAIRLCAKCRREGNGSVPLFKQLCPPLYQDTERHRLPQVALHAALEWKPGPQGMVLVGKSRAGKSRIMWLVIEKYMRDFVPTETKKQARIYCFDSVSFGHELARQYRNDKGEDWIKDVSNSDLVFFDDFGKEKYTERVEAEVFGIIEHRMAWLKPILATTEQTSEGMSDRVSSHRGPAMINRLRESCVVIPVP